MPPTTTLGLMNIGLASIVDQEEACGLVSTVMATGRETQVVASPHWVMVGACRSRRGMLQQMLRTGSSTTRCRAAVRIRRRSHRAAPTVGTISVTSSSLRTTR